MRLLALLALTAAAAWPQVAQEANRDYQTAESRAEMVQRLENPERLANLRPKELVARLKIAPGSTVVDLGTGTGTLLPDLSAAVGPGGRVIAEDIQTDFLERAKARVKTAGVSNVEFVLGTERDPKLPSGAADLVIVLDAYHHFDYPEQMLAQIAKGLKKGGRLAIVEYHKKLGAMEVSPEFALTHIRAGQEQVVREVEGAGFKLIEAVDHAPDKQYIATFERE
jgi:ubiquinone/menaquinone biosynthesis C-methylase UbiE